MDEVEIEVAVRSAALAQTVMERQVVARVIAIRQRREIGLIFVVISFAMVCRPTGVSLKGDVVCDFA